MVWFRCHPTSTTGALIPSDGTTRRTGAEGREGVGTPVGSTLGPLKAVAAAAAVGPITMAGAPWPGTVAVGVGTTSPEAGGRASQNSAADTTTSTSPRVIKNLPRQLELPSPECTYSAPTGLVASTAICAPDPDHDRMAHSGHSSLCSQIPPRLEGGLRKAFSMRPRLMYREKGSTG